MKAELAQLATTRLFLRLWQEGDAEPFAAMNADPRVREHFPSVLSRAESDASLRRISTGCVEPIGPARTQ